MIGAAIRHAVAADDDAAVDGRRGEISDAAITQPFSAAFPGPTHAALLDTTLPDL
jgi:hypothetical protein